MSDLETRYRTVLYWYPSTWREQNADVVIGTLMDEADAAGRTHPRASELISLAFNGARARAGHVARISRLTRDRLAALAFGTGFALMVIMFLGNEWAPLAPNDMHETKFGPFESAAVVINLVWVIAFVVALAGFRRWSRVILAFALVASVVAIPLINLSPIFYARPPASALALLIALAILAMLGRPTRRWLAWSGALSTLLFVSTCLIQYATNSWRFHGWLGNGWMVSANGWWGITLFVLAAVLIALRLTRWVVPVILAATLWTLYSVGANFTHHPDFTVVFFATIGLVLTLIALAAASVAARGYRIQLVKLR